MQLGPLSSFNSFSANTKDPPKAPIVLVQTNIRVYRSIYRSGIKHNNLLQNIQCILLLRDAHTMYRLSYLKAKEILQPIQILSLKMRVQINL